MGHPAFAYVLPNEFLELEIRKKKKHEYFEGRVYDMAGAGLKHNVIAANLTEEICSFLKGKKCRLYGSDLRITTPDSDAFMYPDFSIVCGDLEVKKNTPETVVNPSVIIEIMSPSTRGYDMAFKFHYYKQIPSLREYILVDATRVFVQGNSRKQNDTWLAVDLHKNDEVLEIKTIGLKLTLSEIYRTVSF